jgi:hypothetical protein
VNLVDFLLVEQKSVLSCRCSQTFDSLHLLPACFLFIAVDCKPSLLCLISQRNVFTVFLNRKWRLSYLCLKHCFNMKNAVSWDVAPCGGTCHLHLQGRRNDVSEEKC